VCDKKPALKLQNGCNAPPTIPGGEWKFPEMNPRAVIDRCPLRFVTSDIKELFGTVNLADGRLSVTEQLSLPAPYVEAFRLAVKESYSASTARMDRKSHV